MRAPLSWLKDFAAFPDDVALLRATLDDLGLVVEDVELVGEGLDDVVIAKIIEISAIEGADKIRKVLVDAGGEPLEIVCGATNFALDDLVPLAPVGAVLPGDFVITTRKMRGVTSNGMLCSGRELGVGDDHEGLLILTEQPGAVPGASLVDVLGIERDVIFDVTVEGNRPDAWCISGIARDLAARLSLPFSPPSNPVPWGHGPETVTLASGEVLDHALCPRLGIGVLNDVEVGPSPSWLQERLRMAGMRPINNVVDASNYVMLELGQPTHPYDVAKIPGRGLRVRRAQPGEKLETLDGITRELGRPGKRTRRHGRRLRDLRRGRHRHRHRRHHGRCDLRDRPADHPGALGGGVVRSDLDHSDLSPLGAADRGFGSLPEGSRPGCHRASHRALRCARGSQLACSQLGAESLGDPSVLA